MAIRHFDKKFVKILCPSQKVGILYIYSVLGPHVDTNESEDPNLFVFITHLTPPSGGGSFTVGVAWGGSVCYPDSANINGGTNNGKGFRTSINSWVSSDLGLSEVKKHTVCYLY